MRLSLKPSHRAEFNYVTPIFLIFLIVGGWALYSFIPAYYSQAKYETDLSGLLIKSRRLDDEQMLENMTKHFSQFKEIEFTPEDFQIIRNEETPNILQAKFKYRYLIRVPYTEKIIRLSFELENTQDFTLQNSFQ